LSKNGKTKFQVTPAMQGKYVWHKQVTNESGKTETSIQIGTLYDLKLSRQPNKIKLSWANSCVGWLNSIKTNISRTISVLILAQKSFIINGNPVQMLIISIKEISEEENDSDNWPVPLE
jgi:hypothetical protein